MSNDPVCRAHINDYKNSNHIRMLLEFHACDGATMDLVGPVGKAQGANAGIGFGEAEIGRHAGAAMGLNGVVDDLERDPWRGDLDHGDFALRHLVADRVHHPGGLKR